MADKTPDWLVYGDGFADVTLNRPMDMEGTKVSTLRMREPEVADQLASDKMPGGDADKEVNTFANLCQVSPADLQRMKLRDYARLQAAFRGFID